MFLILYYDVNTKRCVKLLKTCRKYLTWVQNSVFEGEVTEAKFERLKHELKSLIKEKDGDSVVIYQFRNLSYSKRVVIGKDKKGETQFL